MTFLSQHLMNLRHRPAVPEPPVANLDNHFQREATATHRQRAGGLRRKLSFLLPLWALGVAAPIADTHHQVTPFQKDHVLPPQGVGTLQNMATARTSGALWTVVTLWNSAIVFCSSHLPSRSGFGLATEPSLPHQRGRGEVCGCWRKNTARSCVSGGSPPP